MPFCYTLHALRACSHVHGPGFARAHAKLCATYSTSAGPFEWCQQHTVSGYRTMVAQIYGQGLASEEHVRLCCAQGQVWLLSHRAKMSLAPKPRSKGKALAPLRLGKGEAEVPCAAGVNQLLHVFVHSPQLRPKGATTRPGRINAQAHAYHSASPKVLCDWKTLHMHKHGYDSEASRHACCGMQHARAQGTVHVCQALRIAVVAVNTPEEHTEHM